SMLSRSARIVPEIRDGRAAGFRLFSVRPDGPFAKIGLQNGDVISAINGLELTSPDKALEVYTKLKSASHLSVGVERNGPQVPKAYNIRSAENRSDSSSLRRSSRSRWPSHPCGRRARPSSSAA